MKQSLLDFGEDLRLTKNSKISKVEGTAPYGNITHSPSPERKFSLETFLSQFRVGQ